MKLGVVGLPNVGKSTLFNALTQAGAQSANYPFCTIDPNVGVVPVPDKRLDVLTEMYKPEKTTPTTIEFVDIAGLVKGASRGEGLGNKFLAHIREVDAIVHVVRCFENEDIIHVDGSVDPVRDMETINFELIFADMDTVEKRLDRVKKSAKSGDKRYDAEIELLGRVYTELESGKPVRAMTLSDEERVILHDMFLLTSKPVIYVGNVDEDHAADAKDATEALYAAAQREGAGVLTLCARLEEELVGIDDPAERADYMEMMGLSESGLNRLVSECYRLLGLISYLTAGPKEVRAWTITQGMKAPQAAGKIHTDFERGFICAEVVHYDSLVELGSIAACKERGLVRSEGKEYVVKDGDVVLFRFNV